MPMLTEHVRRRFRQPLLWAALAIVAIAPTAQADDPKTAEPPMTVEEVVAELAELTPTITPFTVTFDAATKALHFHEILETLDKVPAGRVGELRARLDRMDPKRMNYTTLEAGMIPIILKGKSVVGRANFHCREGEMCIARQLRLASEPRSLTDGVEQTFGIDIFDGTTFGQLHRFADLITNLILKFAQ